VPVTVRPSPAKLTFDPKLLNGIADTVAQTVSASRQRSARARPPTGHGKKDGISIEIHELGEKGLPHHHNDGLRAPPHFDFERLIRYMAWGFLMAPLQLAWFAWLSEAFPMREDNKTSATLWRVLFDQILFSPISLAMFFAFMTLAEGAGFKAVRRKLDSVFWMAL
jgi:protein Mpv17